VYLGGVFTAISHGLPAGIAALVVGLQPLLTALGAGLLLGEKVRPRQWGGLVLGLAGVALVVSHKVVGAAGTPQLAAMLGPVLLALVGITAGTLYQKRFCPAFDLRTGSVIQFVPTLLATSLVASQTEAMVVTWSGHFVLRCCGWCWCCRWAPSACSTC
jgi:drug/metabolite transporter (DMT)-like permease